MMVCLLYYVLPGGFFLALIQYVPGKPLISVQISAIARISYESLSKYLVPYSVNLQKSWGAM